MRTIGFLNWKGGVGKTSIAINTAYALAESWGVRVLFIDMDKQGNASYWFDCDESRGTLSNLLVSCTNAAEVCDLAPMTAEEIIQPTRYPNIDLIAGDPQLLEINLAILKNAHGRQDNILSEALAPIRDRYDVCIIDNPPDSNIPVLNGLRLMDDVVAVTLPNRFSLNGVEHLEQEIRNLGLAIAIRGVIVNQFTSTDGCYAIVDELREKKYRLFPHIRGGKATQKWLDQGMVFRKFFAEEILDISSSKLQRLESIKKMSEKVKTAVENGFLRESSAVRLSGMALEKQDEVMAWLEENGRRGTMQDVEDAIKAVQPEKTDFSAKGDEAQDEPVSSVTEDFGEESAVVESDNTAGEETSECCDENDGDGNENLPDSKLPHYHSENEEDSAFLPEKIPGASQLMDVPDSFDNPQKEAEDWFRQERLAFYRSVYGEAKHLSESEPNERKAAQWGIRASVARYHIAELMEKK